MTRTAHPADRPTPVLRECDGAPWPTESELDLDTEWATFRESGDEEWRVDAESSLPHTSPATGAERVPSRSAWEPDVIDAAGAWDHDDVAHSPVDAALVLVDLDARLGHLEDVVRDRQRATADEYRLILAILDDAAFDPTPWVGPDPTIDRAWTDSRGRTSAAVRRDRIDLAERAAVAEIAVRLRMSEQTVRTRAAHARTLVAGCPALWSAFSEGRLSEKHAVDAARLASTLPAGDTEAFRRFDEGACPAALTLPPAKFAVAARALRERVHAESLESRHRRAAEDRGVWMTAELDGMASLHALLPADRARAVMSRLDRAARHLRPAPDERRTLAQLRADAFADLVTRTEGAVDAVSVTSTTSDTSDSTPRAGGPVAVAPPPLAPAVSAPSLDRATSMTRSHAAPGAVSEPRAATPAVAPPPPGQSSAAFATPDQPPPGPLAPDTPHVPDSTHGPNTPHGPDTPPLPDPPPVPDPRRTFRNAPPATVVVTIPALTLLGHDTEPATLEGYGPIDLDTARRLAGTATSWIRLLTHPVTGAPLVLDRKTYRVPVALRRWLGVTSPTCIFPGCSRTARECDIDHLTAWADGGTTDDDNLDPKCRHHHRLRHESRWDVDQSEGIDTAWTSPLGGRYGTDPPPF